MLWKRRFDMSKSFMIGLTVSRLRILSGKAWEDRPLVLRQIEQIGEKS
jgi:hypothetical protein